MIKLPTQLHINKFEEIMTCIEELKNDDYLYIPIAKKHFAFGGLAAAVQCINTWARKVETKNLILNGTKEQVLQNIETDPYKFIAAMMSNHIYLEEPNNEEEVKTKDIRLEVNQVAKECMEKQAKHSYGQWKGTACWFTFVDHSSKRYDPNFYIKEINQNYIPKNANKISYLVHGMIEKSSLVAAGSRSLEDKYLDYIGRIFYELFLNSHEHGSRGKNRSDWLTPGVRLLYTNGINLNEEAIKNMINETPAMTKYLENLPENEGNKKRFIEISIIDSGLGYSGRWIADNNLNDSITIEYEYKIFKDCFSFRKTSLMEMHKGLGLPLVMERLSQLKGFMRIRTGRLSLYRDFVNHPYELVDDNGFYDWESLKSANERLSPMSNTAGVAITLFIPLESR